MSPLQYVVDELTFCAAGDNKRNPEEAPREAQEQPGKSYMTAISGPPASGQLGGPGMSSQHPIGSSPYSIGQADGGSFVSGSMNPPGSIALNGAYSAAHSSAYSSAQRSGSGSGGHVIGEADFSVGMSMGSNAVVSRQLGISQMGSAGAYGTAGMSTFRGSSGELSSGYPGSSGRMAMPGEIMGSVTIPILNTSPFPVPVTGSSHAGQQQYGDQARFYSGYMVCPAYTFMLLPLDHANPHVCTMHQMCHVTCSAACGLLAVLQTPYKGVEKASRLSKPLCEEKLVPCRILEPLLARQSGTILTGASTTRTTCERAPLQTNMAM